ncbi:MAG: sugar ABC transporter substrate-binding protein [Pseudonocardiales bacterium]|nr:MAG: sugar ABC transporter substrate-binding protein [Pseudonocardiales bacterium]
MKRTRIAAVLAIVAMVAVAGCSKKDNASTSTKKGSLKGQTVSVTATWSKDEQKNFEAVLKGFETQTGAKVQYTSAGDQIAQVLGTAIAGGSPPDVAVVPQPGLIKQFLDKGAVKELPADVQAAVKANYGTSWQQLGTIDGKMVAVFFKGANKSTVWYRTDAFKTAGVQEPATFDDFTKVLGTIRDSGTAPLSVGGGDGWTLTDWFENVYIRVAGADKYDQLTKHQIPWTDQSVKDTLKVLGKLWGDKTLLASNPTKTPFPDSVSQVFGTKKAAVVYEGDFVAGVIAGSTKAKVGTDAKFFAFPSVNGSKPAVVGGGDAAVMMSNTPAAKALMKYLASPEAASIWVKLGGFTSPNKSVDLASYPDDTSRAIAKQLVEADVFRFDMSDLEPSAFGGTPGKGEWKDLQDFLAAPTTVDATAAQLEKDAAPAYK